MSTVERLHLAGTDILVQQGAGTPFVFLHGIGSAASSFSPLMAALGSHAALAWDAPGYGASEPLAPEWPSASDYAARLLALLDAASINKAHLVGHSLGVLTAARFALEHPDRVDGLTLISPAMGYKGTPGGELPGPVASRLSEFERLGGEAFARARAARLVYQPDIKPHVAQAVEAAMAKVKMPGYGQASRLLGCADLLADAAKLALPVQVITGLEDVITPPANAENLFAALPAGKPHRFDRVPACGHAICQEAPDTIARLLLSKP